jgi:hypothetical protein
VVFFLKLSKEMSWKYIALRNLLFLGYNTVCAWKVVIPQYLIADI